MNSIWRKRLYAVGVLAIIGVAVLLAGQKQALGDEERGGGRKLHGTWDVTLMFPACTPPCSCPGGVPNIPIPALHTYSSDGSILEAGGGLLFRGPGLGSWEYAGNRQFDSRFKFFVFKPDGTRAGSEVVTNHITLTGPDSFQANATFDFFDPVGHVVAQGCPINETATRFED
jgi:hypothetical protein